MNNSKKGSFACSAYPRRPPTINEEKKPLILTQYRGAIIRMRDRGREISIGALDLV